MSEEAGKMNAWFHRFEEFLSGFHGGSDGKEWLPSILAWRIPRAEEPGGL